MANSTLRAFNSLGGFSVQDDPQIVIIDANGNVTTNVLVVNNSANLGNVGNVYIGGGSAGQVLQTDGNGNLTWSSSANVNQIHNGNSNVTIPTLDGNVYINANAGTDRQWVFDTTGNTTLPAIGVASLGNLATANYVNVSNDLTVTGLANITGNLKAGNANLGNLATANYVNVSNDLNVTGVANITGNLSAGNANLGNLATANFVNVSSNLQTSNLGITGNITGNLIPAANVTYSLGNATNAWKDLYLSGSTIYIASQNISANTTSISVSNDFGANSFFANNNVTANANIYANTGYVYANYANVQSNLYVGGNANVVNTLTAANIVDTNLSNTQIVFTNASNALSGSANLTFDFGSNTLNVGGSANITNTLNGNVGNFTGTVTAANFNANGTGNVSNANVVSANSFTSTGGVVDFSTNNANVQLGNVGNVHILGGTDGYVLTTDGTGNLTWAATASQNAIYNGNSNVEIATANGNVTITAGGIYTWTFDASTGLMSAPGGITSTGTINANYITAALDITATGNINANTGYINANYVNISNDLQVNNNANISMMLTAGNANIGTLTVGNITSNANLSVNNLSVNLELQGNTANFSGTVVLNAANVTNDLNVGGAIHTSGSGGDITMTGGNITGVNNISANSANLTNLLQGNTANFTGNVEALNFIGNLANGSSNIQIDNGGNITFSPGTGYGNAVTISNIGLAIIGNLNANGTITSNTGFVSNSVTAFANTPLTLSAGTATGSANINVSIVPSGNGTVDVSSARITNLGEPTQNSDAATKYYVDTVAQGLNVHTAAYAGTTGTLAVATGGTVTYHAGPNGAVPGVGAYLSTTGTFHFIDGANVQTVGTRILVKNEANAVWNGVYTYSNTTTVVRATDEDQNGDFAGGDFLFITTGDTLADTGWVQTVDNVVVGTSNIEFTQFSGAGQYTANTSAGLLLTGTVFSAKVDGNANPTIAFDGSGNLYVPANAAFTTPNVGAATGTSLDLTGNVLAANINANALITAANVDVTGNIRTGNITANVNITATANLSANNANITNNITVGSANVTGNLQGNIANFSGNLTSLNANLGNLATANYVNVTTQINGNIANFTGNLTAANADLGNLAIANYVNVANDLSVTGTANIGNVNLTGDITANSITSNNRVSATNLKIGNSYIYANTATTTGTTPQTICSFMITNTDVYGIEYIVKSYDAAGSGKYSMATVQSVTNGLDVDYVTYATVRLGNTTGQLSVTRTAVGSDVSINLVATPATNNATVWTTQYRLI